MTLKTKIILLLIALATSFAFGRYSVPASIEKKTEKVEDKIVDRDTHQKTTTTTIKKPNGEIDETTVTENDTTSKLIDVKDSISTEKIESKKPMVNVSILGAHDFKNRQDAYGASVSKEFIGPITLGAFGLTSGVLGITIGLNF